MYTGYTEAERADISFLTAWSRSATLLENWTFRKLRTSVDGKLAWPLAVKSLTETCRPSLLKMVASCLTSISLLKSVGPSTYSITAMGALSPPFLFPRKPIR